MDNPSRYRYISRDDYEDVLRDLNIDLSEEDGFTIKEQRRLIDRAVGDLESDLVKRFVVPLVFKTGGNYENSPFYAKQKVINALKAKIRELIGHDKMKNIVIDSSERYIDLKRGNYKSHIKELLDHERIFDFKLQPFADDGSVIPTQKMGIARPDDSSEEVLSDQDFLF